MKEFKICPENECTGCGACVNVCPLNIICMKPNALGNIIPKIEVDSCIECHLCENTCPVINPIALNTPFEVYAAYAKDNEIRIEAASGGMATVLSENFVENSGIVYGSSHNGNLNIEHIRVDNMHDLLKLRGSKYTHSHINIIYKDIKKDLQSGRKVLFVGTPCEVAGLKSYIGDNLSCNLFCIDLICHGVTSHNTFFECMKMETGENDFNGWNIKFRNRENFEIKLYKNDPPKEHILNLKNSFYYNGFMEGYIYRQNCYECQYAQSKRCGDITLGDFWGLGADKPFEGDISNGINVVLVNTDKGKQLFENCKNDICFWARTLSEAVNGNNQLRHPTVRTKSADRFERLCIKYNAAVAVKKCNPKKTVILNIRAFINKNRILYKAAGLVPFLNKKI